MRRVLGWTCAAVLAVILAGCTSTGHSEGACESCTYAYMPVKKSVERRTVCMKDGKVYDCTKSPAECPECAKMQKGK